jgi:hypothetical protein
MTGSCLEDLGNLIKLRGSKIVFPWELDMKLDY